MFAIMRSWWPVATALAVGLTADGVFKSSYGELGEHAAGHLASAGVLFPGLAAITIILWATPRAGRRAELWFAAICWVAALVVVMVGNLRVVHAIGGRLWTEEDAAQLGAGLPAFQSGHDLAAAGAWTGVGAAVLLAILLVVRGHVTRRAGIGSVVVSLVVPPFIVPGAGVLVLVVALCLARWRRDSGARAVEGAFMGAA